jgi:hypothetical protein
LDLSTFLVSPNVDMTAWVVHSDWCSDVDERRIPEDSRQLLRRVVALSEPSGMPDFQEGLRIASEIVYFLDNSTSEDGSIAALSALDCLAYRMLAAIGARRLRALAT